MTYNLAESLMQPQAAKAGSPVLEAIEIATQKFLEVACLLRHHLLCDVLSSLPGAIHDNASI